MRTGILGQRRCPRTWRRDSRGRLRLPVTARNRRWRTHLEFLVRPYGVPAYSGNPGFTGVNGAFAGLMVIVEYESDHAPVDAQWKAFHDYCTDLNANLALWRTINRVDLTALNESLEKNGLKALAPAAVPAELGVRNCAAGFFRGRCGEMNAA